MIYWKLQIIISNFIWLDLNILNLQKILEALKEEFGFTAGILKGSLAEGWKKS